MAEINNKSLKKLKLINSIKIKPKEQNKLFFKREKCFSFKFKIRLLGPEKV